MWQEPISDYPVEKCERGREYKQMFEYTFFTIFNCLMLSIDEVSWSRYIHEGNGSLYMEKLRLPVVSW